MPIRYEKRGNVAIFTIENGKVNAVTPRIHKQFHDHLRTFLSDQSIHVGILTGAGKRCFSGGDDVKDPYLRGSDAETLNAHFYPSTEVDADFRPGWDREVKALDRFKPIIAAVNGTAVGMGLIYLLMHTDLRISVPEAFFGLPEIQYGMGGASGSAQIVRHLPRTVAMRMCLTGEPLSADEALKHSLLNEIVPREKLMERAMELAQQIAKHPPIGVRVEMEVLNRSYDLPKRELLAFTHHLYRLQRVAYLTTPGTKPAPLSK